MAELLKLYRDNIPLRRRGLRMKECVSKATAHKCGGSPFEMSRLDLAVVSALGSRGMKLVLVAHYVNAVTRSRHQ
jgi:hypothetical protein